MAPSNTSRNLSAEGDTPSSRVTTDSPSRPAVSTPVSATKRTRSLA